MKKVNPKDLEVNPHNLSNNPPNEGFYATGIICVLRTQGTECNFQTLAGGCQNTQVEICQGTTTEKIDCDTVTHKDTICICRTDKCVNTVDGCADTVSKGELCCPMSEDPTCNCSIRCESKDYCPVTEEENCNSINDILCFEPVTDKCDLKSDNPEECQIISATCID